MGSVFISYSHADDKEQADLRGFLEPLERKGLIKFWDDRKIQTGDDWSLEIDRALTETRTAVLLITNNFLKSQFIAEQELPYLLDKHQKNEITLLPVFLRMSNVKIVSPELAVIQGFGSPDQPLSDLRKPEREKKYVELSERLAELAKKPMSSTSPLSPKPSSEPNRLKEVGENGASDLNISPLSSPRRLTPLDGHPVLSSLSDPSTIYTGGFHVSFTLAHNGKGKHSINLNAMELEIMSFVAGTCEDYTYRIKGDKVIGAGMAKPHIFSVMLFGNRVTPAKWVTDTKLGTFTESRSTNFFDTEDQGILTFPAGGADIEEIRGTVVAQETGLYMVRFVFYYSVAAMDRQKATEAIYVYTDE